MESNSQALLQAYASSQADSRKPRNWSNVQLEAADQRIQLGERNMMGLNSGTNSAVSSANIKAAKYIN